MNSFGDYIINGQIAGYLQIFPMIFAFPVALYVALRITCVGVDIRSMLRSRPRMIVCTVLTALGTGSLAYMFLSHLEYQVSNASFNRILVWISGVYVAFIIYFLLLLAIRDILCLLLRISGHRNLPVRLFMMLSAGIAALLTFYGLIHARDVRTVSFDISSEERLSAPLRIVEVSDLHMGSIIGTAHVQRVVDAVNARHPDLVVFTGDQFNRTSAVDVVDAGAMFRILSTIEAPLGVYAVLGNHDPELNSEIYQRFLSESGITALDNSVLEIIPGDEIQPAEIRTLVSASPVGAESAAAPETPVDGAILLAGRTKLAEDQERVPLASLLGQAGLMPDSGSDAGEGDSEGAGEGGGEEDDGDGGESSGERAPLSLSSAASSASDQSDHYLLVLDHDPDGIEEAVSCNADLVLSGHTHRGQFFPTTLVTRLSYEKECFYGMARTHNEITGHITTSIVSSGAGYFQTPIRIGTDSEIVCIEINR